MISGCADVRQTVAEMSSSCAKTSVARFARRVIAIICGIGLLGPIWSPLCFASEPLITCSRIEVLSLNSSSVGEREHVAAPNPLVKVKFESKGRVRTPAGIVHIIAIGPVLGSMDSRAVRIHSVCTKTGVSLSATITRSAFFHGSVLQNLIWRPQIAIVARLPSPEASFKITWRMRLTNGVEVSHAQTPTYPMQRYPVILVRQIHRHHARSLP